MIKIKISMDILRRNHAFALNVACADWDEHTLHWLVALDVCAATARTSASPFLNIREGRGCLLCRISKYNHRERLDSGAVAREQLLRFMLLLVPRSSPTGPIDLAVSCGLLYRGRSILAWARLSDPLHRRLLLWDTTSHFSTSAAWRFLTDRRVYLDGTDPQ